MQPNPEIQDRVDDILSSDEQQKLQRAKTLFGNWKKKGYWELMRKQNLARAAHVWKYLDVQHTKMK